MKRNFTPLTIIAGLKIRSSFFALIFIFIADISYSQPACNAVFQFYASPHNPDSIHYAPSNANAVSYLWTFGDGTGSSNHDPWHLYNHPGVYYTCLTIVDANGATCTWCDSIHVAPNPPVCNAHWQFYTNPHNPDSLHFYPNVTSAVSYLWTFGDGTTSTNHDAWHLYANAGAYYVCLTITDINGQTCTWCDSIHVAPPPACNAHWQFYTNPHNPDSLHFYPNVTSAVSYLWTFGDGTTSTNHDPWHLYANAGAYYVCLTITDINGQTCTWCDSIHVAAAPPCNAHWQYYASSHNPDSLHFYPNFTAGVSYLWTFGDGTSSTNHDPWHLYNHPGAYYVCLTVTDANGNTCTWCDSVHVINQPHVCNAHFSFYPNSHNPDSLHFYSNGSPAVSYQWTFGDGTTSNNHDPWHLYAQPGAYYVCLRIVNATGDTCTWCDSIHVIHPPHVCNANFQFYHAPHNPDSMHFIPNGTPATSYLWSFGDGSTSTNHDPWHLYANPGTYYVCLTITEPSGSTCTKCDSIHIIHPPHVCNAHFQFYASQHNPDSMHFYPNVTNAVSYLWTFGDGTTSTNHDPWHFYANAGNYYVCLRIIESTGDTCTTCDSIHVNPPHVCNAHFQFYASTHNPDSLHFYPNGTPAVSYQWSFGDGTTSTNHDPWHLYPHPGAYYVCLTITEGNGNTCTWCDSVHVINQPPVCNAQFQFYASTHNPDSIHYYPLNTSGVQYLWSFGDGTVSTNHDPWHFYPVSGIYYTCLTITTVNGTTCTWCDSIHAMIPSPNPIDPQNQYNSDVRIFPNPVDGIATISAMNIPDQVEFNIYNLTGNRAYRKEVPGNSIFEINTSEIPDGIYYYTMISNGRSVGQGRMVIMH